MKLKKKVSQQTAAVTQLLMTAVGHIEAGRFDAAEAALKAEGGLPLKTPVGVNVLGDIQLKTGRLRDALRSFDKAIKMAPSFPEAHCNRGVVLQEMGRLEEALRAEERALRHRPGYPMANFNRGNVLRDLGRFEDAIAAYDAAIVGRPDFAEALLNRGLTQLELDRPMPAMKDFRAALMADPENASAMVGRAAALNLLGQKADAMADIRKVLATDPDNAEALLVQNRILLEQENYGDALTAVEHLLAARPDMPEAVGALAATLTRMSRFEEAVAAADRAIGLAPRSPGGYVTRAMALGELGRFDEQWKAFREAERLGARGAAMLHARGQVLAERGDYEAALASYREAIEHAPDSWPSHQNLGYLLLKLGDMAEGWREHEWRLKKFNHPDMIYKEHGPRWAGEDLAGKRLLVYNEQGHGDTIQFLRFLGLLKGRGGEVTVLVPSPLLSTIAPAFPEFDVTDKLGVRKDFDYQVSLMSLPAVLGTTLETLPAEAPYLRPDPAYVEKWAARLGQEGFKVGIVWQGNPKYGADRYRSIPLADYAPLAGVPGVRLISLQVFNGLDQLDRLPPGMEVERLGEEVTNNPGGYREVVGVMANLDLLITSDTGPAHLAGALGLPVWVALRDEPDWRWMVGRTDSPWYPTMRLFRQEKRAEWGPVFREIAEALKERVAVSA